MPYNLIEEPWIPIRRASGLTDWISPGQVVDRSDPPMAVQSPRPDFDGALMEFLIGLLQTAFAPPNEAIWTARFKTPPSIASLDAELLAVRDAFFLDGPGPRFMQDLTVGDSPDAKCLPIGALLIDRIGESELGEAPKLFAKPGRIEALSYPAAAAALMALQSYAPAGGRGQLTSLRGGGPLSTIVLGSDLWSTLWLNVMPQPQFDDLVPGDRSKLDCRFPWMKKTRTSETKGGRPTHPQDVHPLQCFWALPRRVRLHFEEAEVGVCSVTGRDDVPILRSLKSRPDGTSYEGEFRHPLTPYKEITPGEPWNPKKGAAGGLPYRDWPQLVLSGPMQAPAIVVSVFQQSRRRELVQAPRLSSSGYAMDKMTPLRWCHAVTPLIELPPDDRGEVGINVQRLVEASEEVRSALGGQIRAAWSARPKDLPRGATTGVNVAFWSRTESEFFATVSTLLGPSVVLASNQEKWLEVLHRAALEIFDAYAEPQADLAASDLRRVVLARRDLVRFSSPTARKLREILGLPTPTNGGRKPPRQRKDGPR